MIKILLAYENYNNLITTESSLKKVGFDVLGITNEYSLNEKILSFNPDLIIVSGEDRGKVKTQSMGVKLKEISRWQGKVILIYSADQDPTPDDLIQVRADQILVEPVEVTTLLTTISMLMKIEAKVLLERYMKYSTATVATPESGGMQIGRKPSTDGPVETSTLVSGKNSDPEDTLFVEQPQESDKSSNLKKENEDFNSEGAFGDINFSELISEIEGNVPSSSGIEMDLPPSAQKSLSINSGEEIDSLKINAELHVAEENIEKRMTGYNKFLDKKAIKEPNSVLSRVDAYKAHKEMVKDWDLDELKKIDTERRKFTNYLFQKPKK